MGFFVNERIRKDSYNYLKYQDLAFVPGPAWNEYFTDASVSIFHV